jgi:phospholipase C
VDASDEFYHDPELGPMPYGLGVRVPMTIVSPWTRGGWVCSQVFDHTSVLRFLEARFGEPMHEPHITAWRRSVCGDLTSAFDFSKPNASWPRLPDTRHYREETDRACKALPDPVVPVKQALPEQEPGTRPARPLPYQLHAHGRADLTARRFWIDFTNEGTAGAVFHVFSLHEENSPRVYTIEARKELSDSVGLPDSDPYHVSVFGPNGFLREFHGSAESVTVHISYNGSHLRVALSNPGPSACAVAIRDNAYGSAAKLIEIAAGARHEQFLDTAQSERWYDFSVTHNLDPHYLCRFAGHIENGQPSTSDPA